jgi:tetratricopeptide (TPR) repeat protein
MMKHKWLFILSISSLLIGGCAEKKTRIWIEPPVGQEVSEKSGQKLYYQVEDIQTGKKENLIIPLRQVPENLTVHNKKNQQNGDSELAMATKADQFISNGKISDPNVGNIPTVSYLRGLDEVEKLYQKKQYSESLIRLTPLIEQYPKQARLFTMQGTLFLKIGEKKMALEAYKRAQKLDKDNPAIEEAIFKTQAETGDKL